jgi:hypothetical protein
MDLAGNYEAPFAPGTKREEACVCVCCGRIGSATYEISQYPFRYIPAGWSVNAQTRALRCSDCRSRDQTAPTFYEQNEVWVDHPDPSAYDRCAKEARVTKRRLSSPDVHNLHSARTPAHTHARDQEPAMITEESEMPEIAETPARKPARTDRLKTQGKEVASAFADGLVFASVNETGEILVDMAKELFEDVPVLQLALAHPEGREAAKLLMATALHTATSQTDIVPQGAFIGEACKKQMTISTFMLAAPRFNKVRKHLQKLAKIGERTASNAVQARVEPHTDEELAEAYAEMEAELNEMKAKLAALGEDEPKPTKRKTAKATRKTGKAS